MFEALDIQFDDDDDDDDSSEDKDKGGDSDPPELARYKSEMAAEQGQGWDLMFSNHCNKQSACQVLCKAYALNRGKMVVAALQNMEEVSVLELP